MSLETQPMIQSSGFIAIMAGYLVLKKDFELATHICEKQNKKSNNSKVFSTNTLTFR